MNGRGFTDEEARAVATGAIYTADDAMNAKLVDSIGYLEDAIVEARTLGGLPADAQVNVVTRPGAGLLGALFSSETALPDAASITPHVARSWLDEFGQVRLAYLTQWIGRP
ncbi:MAG: S49 family peptidase, partial [Planctomycetota bacterium]